MKRNILLNAILILADGQQYNASNKARTDVETILKGKGFEIREVPYRDYKFAPLRAIYKLLSYLKAIKKIEKNDIVWFQYPIFTSFTSFKIIAKKLKKKGCKICFIVHDIESLRFGKDMVDDLNFLNLGDFAIMHTDNMIRVLKDNGAKIDMKPMYLFPYISTDSYVDTQKCVELRNTIAFAGNLLKSDFLKPLVKAQFENIFFRLYGFKCELDLNITKRAEYMGKFSPDNTSFIEAGWGLVWDGQSLDTCDGLMGEYQQYNSPHKLSLYVSAGIPVIVCQKSAFAPLVKKENIGIVVSSIYDIDKQIGELSESEYATKLANVRKVSEKLRQGGVFADIIDELNHKN